MAVGANVIELHQPRRCAISRPRSLTRTAYSSIARWIVSSGASSMMPLRRRAFEMVDCPGLGLLLGLEKALRSPQLDADLQSIAR